MQSAEIVGVPSSAAGARSTAGTVVAVHGVVIDADFPPGALPPIGHALIIQRPSLPLVAEVHAHLGDATFKRRQRRVSAA